MYGFFFSGNPFKTKTFCPKKPENPWLYCIKKYMEIQPSQWGRAFFSEITQWLFHAKGNHKCGKEGSSIQGVNIWQRKKCVSGTTVLHKCANVKLEALG